MFDCNIILYCFILENGYINIISSKQYNFEPLMYKIHNDSLSIQDSIYNLFSEYILTNPQYIKYYNFSIEKNDNNINIYYSAILPIGTKVVDAFKMPYDTVSDPFVHKALRYV